ncbi:MAG: hypothetical protein IPJ69_05220 [Deltaproteobacteria bacterium]|nr:MAG: hypothetical protein IPJ69_05220 [Deltaproteobacteria bacterium]
MDGTLSQYASISGIAIQKDGKIVYTGSQGASNRNSEVGRLNSNGSFDTSFGNLGNGRVMLSDIGTTNYSTQSKDTLLIDNNCSIVIAGDTFNPVQQFSSKNTYDSFNQNVFVARILSGLEGYKCKGYRLTIPTDFHYNW